MNYEDLKHLSKYGWEDYTERGWSIGQDMILRSVIQMDNVPFVLKIEIDTPLLTSYGVQPLRNSEDYVLFKLADRISPDNELRWRVSQRLDGMNVIQRLTISHQLACLDGPQRCHNGFKQSSDRCCGRVEIGTMQKWLRNQYEQALFSQDIEQMAVWVLNVFELSACAFHHKNDDKPSWIESKTEANAKMKWLSAGDDRDMLYDFTEKGADL